jgi:hypothetical protein
VPAAVRQWYAAPGAAARLALRGNLAVTAERLGAPVGGIDYLARGLLVPETDSQSRCRWVVRLRPPPPRYEPETLFDLPKSVQALSLMRTIRRLGIDTIYRFAGPAKVPIAVAGELARFSVVIAEDRQRRSAILSALGRSPNTIAAVTAR